MYAGDLKPDFRVTIADDNNVADFSVLTPQMCRVQMMMGGEVIVDAQPTTLVPAQDGKSCAVVYEWQPADTDQVGVLYWSVLVLWPGGKPQHFPGNTMGRLHLRRSPGNS